MSEREEIEMAFIRILSTDGLILSGAISAEDRRERIRVAIMQRGIKDKQFDASLSFGEAFERCYQRSPELRRVRRDEPTVAAVHPLYAGPGDDEGDEDDDEALEAIEHGGVVGHAVPVSAVVAGPAGELVAARRREAF